MTLNEPEIGTIACHTNKYFIKIGSKLAEEILKETHHTEESLTDKNTIQTKHKSFYVLTNN